jgi:hypothetical protein
MHEASLPFSQGRTVIFSLERTTLMKTWLFLATMSVAAFGIRGGVFAQDEHGHSDVEFAYEGGKIAVEFGDEGAVFEGEFPTEGIDLQFTAEPGFASEVEEGLGIGADDQIVYNVLGDLLFWNNGFKAVPNSAQLRIVNRPPSPLVPDTIVGASTGAQPGSFDPATNRIGAAEADGDFHSDLDFFLEPKGDVADPSQFGAYGWMLTLSTDAAGVADSDPFAFVFNFGLEEAQFEEGVAAFASLVPEPTGTLSVVVALLGSVPLVRRRIRRRR